MQPALGVGRLRQLLRVDRRIAGNTFLLQ